MKKNNYKLQSGGYGYIATSVLEIESLSIGAKTLYTYFVCKSGAKESCFPSNKTIMKSLGITLVTLRKYKKELETAELLIIEERKQKSGRLMSNLYFPTKFTLIRNGKDDENEFGNNKLKNELVKNELEDEDTDKSYERSMFERYKTRKNSYDTIIEVD